MMLKQKFVIDFGAKFIIQLLTALTGIVVARVAGPEIVGTIAFATAYVSLFGFITGSFGSAHIKLVSEGQDEADCNKTYAWFFFVSLSLYAVVVMAVFLYHKFIRQYPFQGEQVEYVIVISLVSVVLASVYQYSQTIFIARTEQAKSNTPELFRVILYNALRIIVVLLGFGAVALATSNALSALLLFPFLIYLMRKQVVGRFNPKLAKRYMLIGLPLFTIVITNSIMTYSDKLILDYFGTIRDIGIYTAAFSIGGMLVLFGNSAGTIFFPLFSGMVSRGENEEIVKKTDKFERFVFVFILPLIVTLSLFSEPIMLTLLGERYRESAVIFRFLVFSSFFIMWAIPYGNVIEGLGLFWLASLLNGMRLVVFLAVLIVCIHPELLNLGVMALAITQVTMNLFMFFSYYLMANRKISINLLFGRVKYFIFWGLIYLLFAVFDIPGTIGMSVYIKSLLLAPVFLLVGYGLQFATRLAGKDDLKLLAELINIRKNLKYVRDEI